MSDTNEEVVEAMDTSQKDNLSSDSETAKSEIIDVGLDQESMKSTSSISSISVGDDKISNPEIVEPIPESDSIPSVKRHKQEDNDSKAKQHHPLSTEEPDKLTQAVDKSSKKTNEKENESSKKPTKRPRLESHSDPENFSNSQKSSTSSEHSMSKNDNGTLYTSKIPPEDPPKFPTRGRSTLVNINNSFFYTPQTRIIHKVYMKLFDFKKFREARSLDINSYDKIVSIAEIPLFLSRFLLEDLLDFVDFLNGTKAELLMQEHLKLSEPYLKARKLVFMRANFETGIQQLESQTVNHLFKQLAYINGNDHIEETTIDVIDLVSETSSGSSSPIDDRILQPDPDIAKMSIFDKIDYLEYKKKEIVKSVFSCVCHTRLVLDFCLEPEYREDRIEFEELLKKYLADIKRVLETLVKVRKECCTLLLETITDDDELNTIVILNIKIQVSSVFKDVLRTLSETNAQLLENEFS